MTLSKGTKNSRFTFVDTKPNIPKKQVLLFGALISTATSAVGIGYAIYVVNPWAQEYFLKLTSFG